MKRKFTITSVWLLGVMLLIAPYFVGKTANEMFLHLYPIGWPYLWSLGFIVCVSFVGGNLFLLALWPISEDIADLVGKS